MSSYPYINLHRALSIVQSAARIARREDAINADGLAIACDILEDTKEILLAQKRRIEELEARDE